MRQILITGATGFIGKSLAAHLVDNGIRVRGTMFRRPAGEKDIALDWHNVGDIGPDTQWDSTLAGVDTIIHTAGKAHVFGRDRTADEASSYRINTEGTLRLARRAAACGVRRLVFLSSIGVTGSSSDGKPVTENTPVTPHDYYAKSKYLAECGIRELCSVTDLEYVIVRPPLVYGPGAPGNFQRLVHLVDLGLPLPLGGIRNARSLISVKNLVEILYACIENPATGNQTYVVSDRRDISTPELVRCIAEGLDRRVYLVPVPTGLLQGLGRLTGCQGPVNSLCQSLQIDCQKIVDHLNWNPRFSPCDAIAEAARSYVFKNKYA